MKAFTGWAITAGLVLAATAANAQGEPQQAGSPHYQAASDFSEPYADVPPPPPPVPPPVVVPHVVPQYGYGEYGAAPPSLLPPTEVYAVLRENGFSPLGVPRLRGYFYTISALDRGGEDGRLVVDARNGRIVRFVPAYGGGDGYYEGRPQPYYGYGSRPQPYGYGPMTRLESPLRPPASVPKVASRTPTAVPVPKAAPGRPADSLAEKPAPAPQRSAAVQVKPADATPSAAPAAAVPTAEAKPAAPALQPTQPMPKVQGLE
jgi:hypothetical protein